MTEKNPFGKISQSPTVSGAKGRTHGFDIADLYGGERAVEAGNANVLDDKLRQAYFWIVNTAIISPHYDIEFNTSQPREFALGDMGRTLRLPTDQSFSSFALIPLLTFALRRKCLFIGGPGRGKTASATLMGLLAGLPLERIRRGMVHGHPQLTITDLLGNPLPKDMVAADSMGDVRIAWREWLDHRVKIVDEYNRIPTRTQSALLTLMGDGYAEILDQVKTSPESAWYLTANDEQGGGTYSVIEALRDRIDVVVQALPFNPRFTPELLMRVESNLRPDNHLPSSLVFTEAEIDAMGQSIRNLPIPADVRRRIEFFASQLELLEAGGAQIETMSKDTARLAGLDPTRWRLTETGRDQESDPGTQTRNGISVRSLMTILIYAKALAWFRGRSEVGLEDIQQILPFTLHGKLIPEPDSTFLSKSENACFLSDQYGWIRQLFDSSCAEYDRLDLDRQDAVGSILEELRIGLDGLAAKEVRRRLATIEETIQKLVKPGKLYGHTHDDLMSMKYAHQRYTNYLRWLEQG